MTRSTALLTGPAAGILLAAGSALALTDGFLTDGGTIARSFADDGARILAGAQVGVLGAALLLWFSASVGAELRRVDSSREPGDGPVPALATAATGGGIAAATLWLASFVGLAAGALRADEDGAIPPAAAQVLHDLSVVLGAAAAPVSAAVLVAALAVASLRTGAALLPRWLAVLSVVLAVALVALPINFAAVPALFVWLVVVGVLLRRS